MIIVAAVLAALAGVLHIAIFAMETFLWRTPRVRATFGLSEQQAEATAEMALNQGYYNLFLAIMAILGAALTLAGSTTVGVTLMIAGIGSMLAAALVLAISSPAKASAALKQGLLPALGLIALGISALL